MVANISTASRATGSSPSTPHQRLFIRTQMGRLELDTRRWTLFHRRLWTAAHLPEPGLGTDVDAHLCALTRTQASALIEVLRKEIGHEH